MTCSGCPGSFGKVFRGTYFGTEVAIKELQKRAKSTAEVLNDDKYLDREVATLKYALRPPASRQ